MSFVFLRLYSLACSFLPRSNIKLLKVPQMWTRRQTLVLWSQLTVPAAFMCLQTVQVVISFFFVCFIPIKSLTASSRSDSSPLHSLSNQNLINLSSSFPRLDFTPFIRCSITLTLTLLRITLVNMTQVWCSGVAWRKKTQKHSLTPTTYNWS